MAQITVAEVLVLLNEHNLLLESQFSSSSHRFDQIAYNSKLVTDNCLFFCKGNFKPAYLDDAQKNGATAYMSEKAYRNAAIPGFIVTNIQKAMSLVSAAFLGFHKINYRPSHTPERKEKTTSAYFTKAILDQTYDRRVALSSTINTVVGLTSKDVVKSNLTTPESLDLFTNMHQAVENGMSHLVMEVSSQAYKKIGFTACIMTWEFS